ncbi:hypothetical protein MTO96_001594 [Rhipicephalus appendiculatus]
MTPAASYHPLQKYEEQLDVRIFSTPDCSSGNGAHTLSAKFPGYPRAEEKINSARRDIGRAPRLSRKFALCGSRGNQQEWTGRGAAERARERLTHPVSASAAPSTTRRDSRTARVTP